MSMTCSYFYPFLYCCTDPFHYFNEYDIAQDNILFRSHSLGLWTKRGRQGEKKYGCHRDIKENQISSFTWSSWTTNASYSILDYE